MLNIIWPIFIIVSFVISLITGNVEELNSAMFKAGKDAVETITILLGSMCLWNGIMKIIEETTLISKLNNLIKPIMKFLFPDINKNSPAYNDITMNLSANVLGLGNAATPTGIKAMESLQKINKNKDYLSENMAIFIILNTASVQLMPSTVIAIRASLGSKNPADIIIPIWIITFVANIVGIFLMIIINKRIKSKKING